MNNIITTDKLYDTERRYRLVRVESPIFGEYQKRLQLFKTHLEQAELIEQWQAVYRYYKKMNFICSSTLLSPARVHKYLVKRISGLEEISRLHSLASDDTRACFDELVKAWKRIMALDKNPLCEAYEAHGSVCQTVFYNPEGRLNDMYRAFISQMNIEDEWAQSTSSTAAELKRSPVHKALVFTGAPKWAFMTDREHVLTAPRAGEVLIICFSHHEHKLKKMTQLVTDESNITIDFCDFKVESDVVPAELQTDQQLDQSIEASTEFALPMLRLPNQTSGDDDDELREYADAYHIALTDEKGVWLGVDSSTRIIEPEGSASSLFASKCSTKKVRDLAQGDIVVVSTGGANDVTEQLADKILSANHGWCRGFQKRWKDELRSAIRRLGLELVVDHLKQLEERLGGERPYSNRNNIRNWCSPRNIRPGDDNTFRAILKYTGLEDEYADFINSAKLIRQAHMKAGRMVANQIRKSVEGASLSVLFENERQDFQLPELTSTACQSAFIVDRVNRNRQSLPKAMLGDLHELDDLYE